MLLVNRLEEEWGTAGPSTSRGGAALGLPGRRKPDIFSALRTRVALLLALIPMLVRILPTPAGAASKPHIISFEMDHSA
jgi:hypothetical protein